MALADRLKEKGDRRRARDSATCAPVKSYVRAHLAEITAARAEFLTWDEIAEAIAEEGIRWRGGKKGAPSAKDLRTLYSRLRRETSPRAATQHVAKSSPAPSSTAPRRTIPDRDAPLPELLARRGELASPAKRASLLEEMRRSTRERTGKANG